MEYEAAELVTSLLPSPTEIEAIWDYVHTNHYGRPSLEALPRRYQTYNAENQGMFPEKAIPSIGSTE